MINPVVMTLIRKDFYLMRWIVTGSIVFGLAMIAIMPLSMVAFYGAGTFLIVTIILLNITIVQALVTQERKDKAFYFILSAPINYRQYRQAKIAANMLGYFVTWTILTLAFLLMVTTTQFPDGFIPFAATLLIYSISYYLCYLAVCLLTDNIIVSSGMVVIGNVSYSFIIPVLFQFKIVTDHISTDNVVWAPVMLLIMGVGMAIGIVSLISAYLIQSHKRDLI